MNGPDSEGNSDKNGKINNPTFILIVLAAVAVIVMYVESMAFPSLPQIMTSFSLTAEDYALASWIVTIYLIVGAVAIPIFGKLGDIYGKKKMLVIAMTIYSIAVTCTGFSRELSDSIYVMIGFRAFQGLGMTMFPLAFSIIRDEFPRDKLAVAQGVISAMFGVGTAVGFVVGGYVTQKWGWEWTYHSVVPFAILLTVLVAWKIKESPVRLQVKIDFLGSALLGAALVTFLVGVTEARTRGWTDPLIDGLLVMAVVFILAFAWWQTKAKEPLVRPGLMMKRNIGLTTVVAFMIGFALFTANQTIVAIAGFNFGLDALETGLLMLPMSVATLILGPVSGLVVKKRGPKWPMVFGMVLTIVGFIMLYQYHGTQNEVIMGVLVMGAGSTFAMVSSINMIIISTPKKETGISTAMNMIVRTSGSVVGPALAAVIISQHSNFVPGVGAIPDDSAYHTIFMMSSIMMAIGVAVALLLKDHNHETAEVGE